MKHLRSFIAFLPLAGVLMFAMVLVQPSTGQPPSNQESAGKAASGKAAATKAPARPAAKKEATKEGAPADQPAAAERPAPSSPDLEAIRAQSAAFVAAFNQGDAKAVAACWTEDGEYVDETGQVFAGRAAIEKNYAEHFSQNPGTSLQIAIDSLRLVNKAVAIEEGRAVSAAAGAAGVSRYTATHVKVDGKWLMASVRDSWIDAPSDSWSSADLEWLIGTWVAEEHGVKMESACRWIANGRFLERTTTVTQLDGTSSSAVQIIGWDPLGGHVQSWSFGADGGHAVGVWVPSASGWLAHMRGTTGEGLPTTSINQLTRLDDNAFAWQSIQRSVGSSSLPDTGEVIWKRQAEAR